MVEARIARQQATYINELLDFHGIPPVEPGTLYTLRKTAKDNRIAARSIMKDMEVINGCLFAAGHWTWPLRVLIHGESFRSWPQYKKGYKNSALQPYGDPE